MPPKQATLVAALKQAQKAQGISTYQIHKDSGVTLSTVQRILGDGMKGKTLDHLEAIAGALGLEIKAVKKTKKRSLKV